MLRLEKPRFQRRSMAVLLGAGIMTALIGCMPAAAQRTAAIGGRDYLLQPGANAPGPLVLVLHGGLGNAENMQRSLGLSDGDMTVAYLNGTPVRPRMTRRRTWNAGACCGAAAKTGVDDVGYISGVISELAAAGKADPARVFVVGHSNGAMMALRFACERPDLVKGVVAVSGAATAPCRSAQGVDFLLINGRRDKNVPVSGGRGARSVTRLDYPSLDSTKATISRAGGRVESMVLESGAHQLSGLQESSLRETGKNLAQIIAAFVRARS